MYSSQEASPLIPMTTQIYTTPTHVGCVVTSPGDFPTYTTALQDSIEVHNARVERIANLVKQHNQLTFIGNSASGTPIYSNGYGLVVRKASLKTHTSDDEKEEQEEASVNSSSNSSDSYTSDGFVKARRTDRPGDRFNEDDDDLKRYFDEIFAKMQVLTDK